MNMKTLIINYKAYEEAFTKGIEIAKYSGELSKSSGVSIVVSPPFTILKETVKFAKTIAQGVNDVDPGAHTGHVTSFELKQAAVAGALLNHSENRYPNTKDGKLDYAAIKVAVDKCMNLGLETYVCVQNLDEAREVLKMKPTGIAYEPPELIGGNISVSNSKPEIVKEFCSIIKNNSNSLALIGAGIKGKEDAEKSVELGSDGLLVASGIMKSDDYKSIIEELVKGLNK
ncbi:MAG: triosephosphate isomerase [Candidatus Parvarchaeum acidiphilum ARMAN-4]|jgi:triosephosphate isomerase|uniref:Triosephosphate isomerase n=1 Tax=Candidatus Parvarchaeum acidiphilum ARMAN-4 TaxID=662760 RepID=D2EF04_PARA4|nr:MAG: triosephosphate isomerase [Candidatus Parvarchaeum acidiphilum ARMAN-4]